MDDDRKEFEKELEIEDTVAAERKVQPCGHPKTAIVSRGKGRNQVSFCAICEADARAISDAGNECAVCSSFIEGSHFECVDRGSQQVCLSCHIKMPMHNCVFVSESLPTKGLAYSYDQDKDILTVEGIKYAGDVFRTMGFAPVGTTLRIEGREDGVVTVGRISNDIKNEG